MTKQEELTVLDSAIKKLGKDSYLGPALQHVRAFIENDMRCDFEPDIVAQISRLEKQKAELTLATTTLREEHRQLIASRDLADRQRTACERDLREAWKRAGDMGQALLDVSRQAAEASRAFFYQPCLI